MSLICQSPKVEGSSNTALTSADTLCNNDIVLNILRNVFGENFINAFITGDTHPALISSANLGLAQQDGVFNSSPILMSTMVNHVSMAALLVVILILFFVVIRWLFDSTNDGELKGMQRRTGSIMGTYGRPLFSIIMLIPTPSGYPIMGLLLMAMVLNSNGLANKAFHTLNDLYASPTLYFTTDTRAANPTWLRQAAEFDKNLAKGGTASEDDLQNQSLSSLTQAAKNFGTSAIQFDPVLFGAMQGYCAKTATYIIDTEVHANLNGKEDGFIVKPNNSGSFKFNVTDKVDGKLGKSGRANALCGGLQVTLHSLGTFDGAVGDVANSAFTAGSATISKSVLGFAEWATADRDGSPIQMQQAVEHLRVQMTHLRAMIGVESYIQGYAIAAGKDLAKEHTEELLPYLKQYSEKLREAKSKSAVGLVPYLKNKGKSVVEFIAGNEFAPLSDSKLYDPKVTEKSAEGWAVTEEESGKDEQVVKLRALKEIEESQRARFATLSSKLLNAWANAYGVPMCINAVCTKNKDFLEKYSELQNTFNTRGWLLAGVSRARLYTMGQMIQAAMYSNPVSYSFSTAAMASDVDANADNPYNQHLSQVAGVYRGLNRVVSNDRELSSVYASSFISSSRMLEGADGGTETAENVAQGGIVSKTIYAVESKVLEMILGSNVDVMNPQSRQTSVGGGDAYRQDILTRFQKAGEFFLSLGIYVGSMKSNLLASNEVANRYAGSANNPELAAIGQNISAGLENITSSFQYVLHVMIPALDALANFTANAGQMLGVVLPILPYILLIMAGVGWFLQIILTTFAMPLFLLMHAIPAQSGFIGHQMQGYVTLIGLFFRPLLIIVGFYTAFIIYEPLVVLFSKIYFALRVYTAGTTSETSFGMLASITTTLKFYWYIYAGLLISLSYLVFGLVQELSDNIFNWLGTNMLRGFGNMNSHGIATGMQGSSVGALRDTANIGKLIGQGSPYSFNPKAGANGKGGFSGYGSGADSGDMAATAGTDPNSPLGGGDGSALDGDFATQGGRHGEQYGSRHNIPQDRMAGLNGATGVLGSLSNIGKGLSALGGTESGVYTDRDEYGNERQVVAQGSDAIYGVGKVAGVLGGSLSLLASGAASDIFKATATGVGHAIEDFFGAKRNEDGSISLQSDRTNAVGGNNTPAVDSNVNPTSQEAMVQGDQSAVNTGETAQEQNSQEQNTLTSVLDTGATITKGLGYTAKFVPLPQAQAASKGLLAASMAMSVAKHAVNVMSDDKQASEEQTAVNGAGSASENIAASGNNTAPATTSADVGSSQVLQGGVQSATATTDVGANQVLQGGVQSATATTDVGSSQVLQGGNQSATSSPVAHSAELASTTSAGDVSATTIADNSQGQQFTPTPESVGMSGAISYAPHHAAVENTALGATSGASDTNNSISQSVEQSPFNKAVEQVAMSAGAVSGTVGTMAANIAQNVGANSSAISVPVGSLASQSLATAVQSATQTMKTDANEHTIKGNVDEIPQAQGQNVQVGGEFSQEQQAQTISGSTTTGGEGAYTSSSFTVPSANNPVQQAQQVRKQQGEKSATATTDVSAQITASPSETVQSVGGNVQSQGTTNNQTNPASGASAFTNTSTQVNGENVINDNRQQQADTVAPTPQAPQAPMANNAVGGTIPTNTGWVSHAVDTAAGKQSAYAVETANAAFNVGGEGAAGLGNSYKANIADNNTLGQEGMGYRNTGGYANNSGVAQPKPLTNNPKPNAAFAPKEPQRFQYPNAPQVQPSVQQNVQPAQNQSVTSQASGNSARNVYQTRAPAPKATTSDVNTVPYGNVSTATEPLSNDTTVKGGEYVRVQPTAPKATAPKGQVDTPAPKVKNTDNK